MQLPRLFATSLLLISAPALAQPSLTTIAPARNQIAAARTASVVLTFDQAIAAAAAGKVRLFSAQRGGQLVRAGQSTVTGGNTATLTLDPTTDFRPGETLFLTVPATVLGTNGAGAGPQVAQFTTATSPTGSGIFLPPAVAEFTVGTGAFSIATGDVDSDGDLDLLTANYGGAIGTTVSVRLNDGRGKFATPPAGAEVFVGGGPVCVVLADVDADGDLDFLSASFNFNVISVRLNDGAGRFAPPATGAEVSVGANPQCLTVGDVDADGDLDLLTANYGDGTVSVRRNDGTGAFAPTPAVAVGTSPAGIAVGDVDADGDLDFLTTNYGDGTVSVGFNDGTGAFTTAAPIAVGASPRSLITGDVDGDGDLDVVTTNFGDSTLSVRLNDGAGTFTPPALAAELAVGTRPLGLALGDVDGDGDLDVLATLGSSNLVRVHLNDGHGRFAAPVTNADVSVGPAPFSLALADVNADGNLDVLTANFNNGAAGTVSVRLNQPSAVSGLDAPEAPAPRLVVHPNPTAGSETRVSGLTTGQALVVLDATGRVVRTVHPTASSQLLAVRGLPAGVYVVRSGARVQRLVVE